MPGCSRPHVAPKLIDHETGQQPLILGREQRDRAVQRREDAATIDVPGHDHRDLAVPCQAHVDEVALTQVDLGRAAGAFADHDVEFGPQLVERGERGIGEDRPSLRETTAHRP